MTQTNLDSNSDSPTYNLDDIGETQYPHVLHKDSYSSLTIKIL